MFVLRCTAGTCTRLLPIDGKFVTTSKMNTDDANVQNVSFHVFTQQASYVLSVSCLATDVEDYNRYLVKGEISCFLFLSRKRRD